MVIMATIFVDQMNHYTNMLTVIIQIIEVIPKL